MKSWSRLLRGLGLLATVAGGVLLAAWLRRCLGADPAATLRTAAGIPGVWMPLLFICLYTVRPLVLLPASALTIAAGALWGPLLGTLYTSLGATAGAGVAYYLARVLGRDFVARRLRGRLAVVDRLAGERGFRVILLLRLVPLFPYDAVSYAAGLSQIRTPPFLLGTVLGALPGTLAYAYLGAATQRGAVQVGLALAALAALVLIPWVYHRWTRLAGGA